MLLASHVSDPGRLRSAGLFQRGRQEFGELSFGHRGVLAVVTNETAKGRVLRYLGAKEFQYVQVRAPLCRVSLRHSVWTGTGQWSRRVGQLPPFVP